MADASVTICKTNSRSLQCGERLLSLDCPIIMGVLNVTPDSFSDGGALYTSGCIDLNKVLARSEQMLIEGASIIDVGGESTRPGAKPVSLQQEIDRVLPVVEAINKRLDVVISLDTSSPELMTAAASVGAGLINDVRALQRKGALKAAVATGLPVCLMHMQGQPLSMQNTPSYTQVMNEVCDFLTVRADQCVATGISAKQIIVDPGFGFGKTVPHNLALLNRLSELQALGYPVLVGLSRKTLIGKVLGREVDHRLAGSLTLAILAVERGASIIRVHDVAETADAMALCQAVWQEGQHFHDER